MGSGTPSAASGTGPSDGSPLAELQAAAVVYDSLVKVRAEAEADGLLGEPEERGGEDWNQTLTSTVTDVIRRTQEACKVTTDPNARRAVLMLTRKDLLAQGLQGVAVLLEDLQLGNVALIVKTLVEQYNELCEGWRQLLETQEGEACSKLSSKDSELEASQQALEDLLKASKQLQRDSKVLVQENKTLKAMVDRLGGWKESKSTEDGKQQSQAVHISADPTWLDDAREPFASVGNKPSPSKSPASAAKASGKGMWASVAALKDSQHSGSAAGSSPTKTPRQQDALASPRGRPMLSPRSLRGAENSVARQQQGPSVADKHTLSSQNKLRQKSTSVSEPKRSPSAPKSRPPVPSQGTVHPPVARRRSMEELQASPPPAAAPKTASRTSAPPCTTQPPAQHHKNLSVRQLRDIIDEVFESKRRADKKCQSSGTPRQTMAHHLNDFLHQKLGLRNLVEESYGAILVACFQYERSDAYIKLFQKVLQNEMEEEFIGKLRAVETQVEEELASVLASKLGLQEGTNAMDRALAARRSGAVPEDEWQPVVGKVVRRRERHEATQAIQQLPLSTSRGVELSEGECEAGLLGVEYHSLLHLLLHHCLRSHQRALLPVLQAFRKVDKSKSGVVSTKQFGEFCSIINPAITENEIYVLLDAMDPSHIGKITFSSCASILANELERIVETS